MQINKNKFISKLSFALVLFLLCTSFSTTSFSLPFSKDNEISQDQDDDDVEKENKITVGKVDSNHFTNVAIFQGLNKITAKTSEFEVKIGDQANFGKLAIIVRKCWRSPPDQRPENKILLEIYETGSNNIKNLIFYGWMLSSSPSISGLEHPIYDITALECKVK